MQHTHRNTAHADNRISQRGINPEALRVVCTYGIDTPAGKGCVRRELRNSQVQGLLEEGFSLDVIERALKTEAIYSSDEVLVTCYLRASRSSARRTTGKPPVRQRNTQNWWG